MSGLYLLYVNSLNELSDTLGSFANHVKDGVRDANLEIHQMIEWIQEMIVKFQLEIDRAQERLANAETSLYRCQNSGYLTPDGYYVEPDCSAEQIELDEARRQLDVYKERLLNAKQWQQKVENTIEQYKSQEQKILNLAENRTLKAQSSLHQLAARYSTVHASGAIIAAKESVTLQQSQVRNSTKKEWIYREIQDVQVKKLPDPEGITGYEDFVKISEEEMRLGINRLQEMKPLIDSGEGANSDYWASVDKNQKLEYEKGYQKVYDAFYGNDAIYINKVGDIYDIVNGRHRIWLAKRMGIEWLPMRIIEKG